MITLYDNDTSSDAYRPQLIPPEEKYPREQCPILHRLIATQELNTLIKSTVEQITRHLHLDTQMCDIEVDYDLLLENERGMSILGYPLFSPNLFPWDPAQFTTPQGIQVNGLKLYPLPTNQWHWLWDKWYVVMAGDTDDQGWMYSWRFRGRWWRGRMLFGSVRRRTWIRLRGKSKSILN
jgi:hypothetical protein